EAPIYAAAQKLGIPAVALPIARKNIAGLRALRAWLKRNRDIDVLNTHSSTDSWLVAIARLSLCRVAPIVRTRHVSTHIGNNRPTRWLYQRATRHIVTTGEALKQQLARENDFDSARMTSVPTGIDLQRFRPRTSAEARRILGLNNERHYLGIVATLRNWKGHTYLLQAFATLAPKHPDWDLLLVGDGPQRKNLERMAKELRLGARVQMLGNREDVEHWFNAFDLFTLPSYGEEGVSQSVMQAMASGLPVVSTTVGAIGEAVAHEQTGLLIAPHDAEQLEQALARLMNDATLRQRFGAAGRARAEQRFGVDVMLDAMERVFRAAAGGKQ
ncbi:MAG TPA: glycosyltransferase family 4 protein, partial [Burkholderiaceae bacterium]|nr:glycosyltransferase family 4 protein [Burkholderiaceae bacterium]